MTFAKIIELLRKEFYSKEEEMEFAKEAFEYESRSFRRYEHKLITSLECFKIALDIDKYNISDDAKIEICRSKIYFNEDMIWIHYNEERKNGVDSELIDSWYELIFINSLITDLYRSEEHN